MFWKLNIICFSYRKKVFPASYISKTVCKFSHEPYYKLPIQLFAAILQYLCFYHFGCTCSENIILELFSMLIGGHGNCHDYTHSLGQSGGWTDFWSDMPILSFLSSSQLLGKLRSFLEKIQIHFHRILEENRIDYTGEQGFLCLGYSTPLGVPHIQTNLWQFGFLCEKNAQKQMFSDMNWNIFIKVWGIWPIN